MLQLGGVLALLLSSCSYQWREADAGVDDQELLSLIEDIGKTSSSKFGSNSVSEFVTMAKDVNTAIYFSEGRSDHSGTMGPPASILSFEDFFFMGQPEITPLDMSSARAIFLDRIDEVGVRQNALLIDYFIKGQSTPITKVFMGEKDAAFINEGEFEVEVSSGDIGLVLRSFDLLEDSEDFSGVIQLNVWDFDQNNNENYLGKISTLVGFSNL